MYSYNMNVCSMGLPELNVIPCIMLCIAVAIHIVVSVVASTIGICNSQNYDIDFKCGTARNLSMDNM